MELVDELFEMVRVTRDNHSGLYSLAYPSGREAARRWKELNIRAGPPEPESYIWAELAALVRARMPMLQAMADKYSTYGRSAVSSSRSPPPTIQTTAGDEAIVRAMKSDAVAAAIKSLRLDVPPHPTNAGITVMRGKNALYSYLRRGGKLPGSAPTVARTPSVTQGARKVAKWTVSE